MDYTQILNLLQQLLPSKYLHVGLEAVGAIALVKQVVPNLLSWGVPAAGRAADWTAKTLLNSPFRPVVLYLTPNLVSFLDSIVSALTQILDTFRDELEKDLQAAQPAPAPTPASPASTTPPPAA